MKCPHCEYDDHKSPDHKYSDFYRPDGNRMQIRRIVGDRFKWNYDIASIVGCPSCKKVFIDTMETQPNEH